jgi:hypothetical protein
VNPIWIFFALVIGATIGWAARSQRAPVGFAIVFRDLPTAAGAWTPGNGPIVRLSRAWGTRVLTANQINYGLAEFMRKPRPDPQPQDIGRCTAAIHGRRCTFLAAPGSRYCNVCLSGGQ